MLVSGDQLTMDRYRSLKALHDTDILGEQFNWILLIMGLFHLMMNYLKMFLKNHLGHASDPSSLKVHIDISTTGGIPLIMHQLRPVMLRGTFR